jgi:tetratricopeptide (TPR) repeat protein
MALALLASLVLIGAAEAAGPVVTCKDDPMPPPPLDVQIAACTALIEDHPSRFERINAYLRRAEDYAMQGDAARSQADFREFMSGQHWGILLYRGSENAERGDYDRAIADFDEGIRQNPADRNTVVLYINRGFAYLRKGEADKAIEDFKTGLKLSRDDPVALADLGYAYLSKRDYDHANETFDHLIAVKPNEWRGYAGKADVKERQGDIDGAIAETTAGIKAAPREPGAHHHRCWLRAVANRELEGAREDCEQALKLAPKNPAVLETLGFVELRLSKLDSAIDDLDAALKIEPRRAAALFLRGVAKTRKGDADGGAKDIAAARAVRPSVEAEYAGYGVTP